MITLPQIITLALPVLAMLVSYLLQQEHFNATMNTAIAILTIAIAALASVFVQGHLTSDLYGDVGYVIAAGTALQASTFAPLQKYLKSIPGDTTTTPTTVPGSIPQPITFVQRPSVPPTNTPEHGG